ncbi:MAG: (Fe-S)-binding protein [Deltaproteobacteria bacterium]|nr:(Fe-S)-binding protein [Deltaproteobacteria bacterium]MBW2420223.1 (Fe-S)-binding protein [Deltaproteobacteria bacterium]
MTRPVALFVTCLVDQLYPRVGEATVSLLEEAGCSVEFPADQTCCGQPCFNLGHRDEARSLVRRMVELFEPYETVVSPSGSCVSMLRCSGPGLFADEPQMQERARVVAGRTFELSEYLAGRGFRPSAVFRGRVAYHSSCHLLRELGVAGAPRDLLSQVEGLELVELDDEARCCGFGGAFSVELPELSSAMAADKLAAIERSGADVVTASDVGCLMQLGGALTRRGARTRAVHLAELLAGVAAPLGRG